MVKFEITVTKTDKLQELATKIKNSNVGEEVAKAYQKAVMKTFDSEDDSSWPELSEWRKRERGDGGHPILKYTGKLKSSIQVTKIGDGKYQVSTDIPYAALHEFGGINDKGFEVPQRAFMRTTLTKNESELRSLAERKTKEMLGL